MLNLTELEKKLDESLDQETPASLIKWIKQKQSINPLVWVDFIDVDNRSVFILPTLEDHVDELIKRVKWSPDYTEVIYKI